MPKPGELASPATLAIGEVVQMKGCLLEVEEIKDRRVVLKLLTPALSGD
jgi:hypothetical protein